MMALSGQLYDYIVSSEEDGDVSSAHLAYISKKWSSIEIDEGISVSARGKASLSVLTDKIIQKMSTSLKITQ
jgi:hypothetical protein